MIYFSAITSLIIILDQILKYAIRCSISKDSFIDTLIPFLKIGYVENAGGALGIFSGHRIILILFSLLALTYLLYRIRKNNITDFKLLMSLAFVTGGGISNLIDRIFFGYVTDYLKLTFFPPVCNLADYFITIGVLMIMLIINLKK